MHLSPETRDLLERLSASKTHSGRVPWRWRSTNAQAEDVVALIREIAMRQEPAAVPALLAPMLHGSPAVARAASDAVRQILQHTPTRVLPALEWAVRNSWLVAAEWHTLPAAAVAQSRWAGEHVALLTCHRSGHVREAAVRRLSAMPGHLGFLLLRLNDWVEQVASAARIAVESRMMPAHLDEWVENLPIVERLESGQRADHSWVRARLLSLLLVPDHLPILLAALKHKDRAIARAAFGYGAHLEGLALAEFVAIALASRDSTIRLWAARLIRTMSSLPGRNRLLDSMRSDPSMPVRREALYSDVHEEPVTGEQQLRRFLFDPHASVRHAARVYLRDRTPALLNAREVYIAALEGPVSSLRHAAIGGLGETGKEEDIARLTPCLAEIRPTARAALRAIASLDRNGKHADLLIRMLHDPRPSLAKESRRLLTKHPGVIDWSAVEHAFRHGPLLHTKREALRLLLSRPAVDAMCYAIESCAHEEPLESLGRKHLHQRMSDLRSAYLPSPPMIDAIRRAIRLAGNALSEDEVEHIWKYLGVPSSGR